MTATAIFGDQRNEQGEGVGCRGGRGATQKRDKKRDRNFLPGWLWLVFFLRAALVFRVLLGPLRLRLRFVSLRCAATATNFNKLQLHLPKSASRRIASHRVGVVLGSFCSLNGNAVSACSGTHGALLAPPLLLRPLVLLADCIIQFVLKFSECVALASCS